ncbi:group III truncated hemoglobin [Helicobacter sp. MIT 14-3879]|uniref:group III truncated hemoglobin n=1 Tax=Helicobacter sp. MIT 14-3879 TaxID=2040649 RepID=UPI000E1F003B|nr:group III truncated hemoglobin [Helicobacter sp. MIT 14-3879]RDU64186.1 hypothetical protein CQA44_04480 [Helicobacter sp. MIT 14-3879]
MKYNEINMEGINKLMNVFYEKIRVDKGELGEIFNSKVGTDNDSWDKHKAKIASFWQGMLLGEGDYAGQPMKAHLELPPFKRELFGSWLSLFEESLNIIFESHIAEQILSRARAIAQRFEYMIFEAH